MVRATVARQAANRTDTYFNNLQNNVATALGNLKQEVVSLKAELRTYQGALIQNYTNVRELCTFVRANVTTLTTRHETTNRALVASVTSVEERQVEHNRTLLRLVEMIENNLNNNLRNNNIMEIVEDNHVVDINDAEPGLLPIIDNENQLDPIVNNNSPPREVNNNRTFRTNHTNDARILGQNAFHQMLNAPRRPTVTAHFPETWDMLLEEWNREDLQSFVRIKTSTWGSSELVGRFTKRHRAMRLLRDHMRVANIRDEREAAVHLEIQREQLNMTLSKHVMHLFKNNNTNLFRRRQVRERENN